MANALAVSTTWSSAFVMSCEGGMTGVAVCLFKADDEAQIESIIGGQKEADGKPAIGGRSVINDVFAAASQRLAATVPQAVSFGEALYHDLAKQESYLSTLLGDTAWIGTFSLSIGTDLDTQLLFLYAPHASLNAKIADASPAARPPEQAAAAAAPINTSAATSSSSTQSAPSRRQNQKKEEQPRNFERLLDVELDVVVRFGFTTLPLRDVVAMGTGSMIELDRSVNDPVDLLVNGRQFARGEVVVIDGYYGVRITEVQTVADRPMTLI